MGKYLNDWIARIPKKRVGRDKLSRWKFFEDWLKTRKEFKDVEEIDELIVREFEETNERKFKRRWQGVLERYVVYLLTDYPVLDATRKKIIKKGMAPNSIRSYVNSVRAFFTNQCVGIKVTNLPKSRKAVGEHPFSIEDLRKMFEVGDTRDKALLSTSVSLGWDPDSVQHLPRKMISDYIKRARSKKERFVRFDWYREKEETEMLGCLTPEAIDWIEKYLEKTKNVETPWLFPNSSGKHPISQDTINDIIKRLVAEANIKTVGKIRFYGVSRKFLIPTLVSAGLSEWEVKLIVGKTIPTTDSTYLEGLKPSAFKKYCQAYPKFSLYPTSLTPRNNVRFDNFEKTQLALGKVLLKLLEKEGIKVSMDFQKSGDLLKALEEALEEGS